MHEFAYFAAADAVTSGAEGGSGGHDIELFAFKEGGDALQRLVFVAGHKIVAADDGVRNLGIFQSRLKGKRRTYGPLFDDRLKISLVFSADAAEKLVGIEYNLFIYLSPHTIYLS